ncbi:MAG: DUF177 domain-containing protein [Nitrospirota bacterium]|nr:DUF177 domain-containing protein [Nitrospirota bacterium]
MKIVIPDIEEEGLIVELEEKISIEGFSVTSPVKAQLAVNKTVNEVMVTGSLSVKLEMECSRCLKNVQQAQDLQVSVVYHPAEEIGSEKHGLRDEEMDMGFYTGEELDLQELIREQILLSVQMKPLCNENCKGLCPKCGIDLNSGTCACVQKEIDPRLEVLKKLLDKEKE